MIREFGTGDIVYLVFAARWTLALTALAFAGGAIVGLTLAVSVSYTHLRAHET
jgi:polar amino acid transport system permease protein